MVSEDYAQGDKRHGLLLLLSTNHHPLSLFQVILLNLALTT